MKKKKWIACFIDEVTYPKTSKSEEHFYNNSQVVNMKKVIHFRKSTNSNNHPVINIIHERDYVQWVYPTIEMRNNQYKDLCLMVGIKNID